MLDIELKFEKRATYPLSSIFLKRLLKLPDEIVIVGASYDAERDIVKIYLKGSHERLFLCAEAALSPEIEVK